MIAAIGDHWTWRQTIFWIVVVVAVAFVLVGGAFAQAMSDKHDPFWNRRRRDRG